MTLRALPRTLVPLKDESLIGYLLRLSYRLEFTPLELGQVLGLATGPSWSSGLPARLMFEIDPEREKHFAERARLTTAEIDALSYRQQAAVYPPVNRCAYPTRTSWNQHVVGLEPWLFTRSSRYCPQCLAGDGSAIQARLGGAWSKYWRFAPVFACLVHRRLLDYLCPVCDQLALTRNPIYYSQLIPLPTVPDIHPAACRAPTEDGSRCPGRFDDSARPSPSIADTAVLPQLMALQARLLSLLQPRDARQVDLHSCGTRVTTSEYFADLQVACNILATVLLNPDIIDPAASADLPLGCSYNELQLFAADVSRRARDPFLKDFSYGQFGSQTAVPLDSAACGCLIALADDLLTARDSFTVAIRLDALLGNIDLRRWSYNLRRWSRREAPTSAGMKAAIDAARAVPRWPAQALKATNSPRSRRWRNLRNALTSGITTVPRFGVNCIPQRLPDAWWSCHFDHQVRPNELVRRRLAVITLTAIAEQCSLPDAMRRLDLGSQGLSLDALENAALTDQHYFARFETSVSDLVEDLNGQAERTDYDRRRRVMRHWTLDEPTWRSLTLGIRNKALPQTTWGDSKQLLCAIYIWRRVTEGEHLRAPMLPPPFASSGADDAKRAYVRTTWREFSRVRPHSYLRELVRRIDEYSEELIAKIDGDAMA